MLTTLFFLPQTQAQRKWEHADYGRYNYQTFPKSDFAKRKIDFNDVDYGLLNAAVFYLSNYARARSGLKTLSYSAALEKAAFGHSRDMIRLDFFSHTSPVEGKTKMSDRMRQEGVQLRAASENIAMNYASLGDTYLELAQRFVKQWLDSPPHRKNLFSSSFTYMGCGAYLDYRSKNDRFKYFKVTQNLSATTGQDPDYGGGLDGATSMEGISPNSAQSRVSAPTGTSTLQPTRYLVLTGGDYPSRREAEQSVEKLQKSGFSQARLITIGQVHNVALGVFSSTFEAQRGLTGLRKQFPAAWILRLGKP